jgi:hypothetical protein
MGSRQSGAMTTPTNKIARPILNERDYQAAKDLLEREMKNAHSDRVWQRLEALMQEVAEYEARFVQGEDEDPASWLEYAYASALDESAPRRRWTDTEV